MLCNHTYFWSYYLPSFGGWLEDLHGCRSVGERPWMYVAISSFTYINTGFGSEILCVPHYRVIMLCNTEHLSFSCISCSVLLSCSVLVLSNAEQHESQKKIRKSLVCFLLFFPPKCAYFLLSVQCLMLQDTSWISNFTIQPTSEQANGKSLLLFQVILVFEDISYTSKTKSNGLRQFLLSTGLIK